VLALSALALAFACAPAASASTGGVRPRIVNGADATIEDFPFQVLLFQAGTSPAGADSSDPGGRLCGGVVKDATHVITAAHCVFDVFRPSEVSSPTDLQVFAGSADLTDSGATIADVTDIAFDPQYDPSTNVHDVALLTLGSALFTGTPSQNGTDKIAPIDFASSQPADNTNLTVSGWGDMSEEPADGSGTPSFSNTLQSAVVPLVNDTQCSTEYGAAGVPVDTTLLFCAGDNTPPPVRDSCQGDSGGPIVTGSAGGYTLLGLVDSGIGCAQSGFPGIYTRLVNTSLQDFLNSSPPDAPSRNTNPSLSGGTTAGQTLTCASGDWTGSPSFTYQFFRSGSNAALTAATANNTYTVQQADVGSRIQCEVEATNAGGFGFGESNTLLIPIPPQPPQPPSGGGGGDTIAPKLRLGSKKCTKTSCTLKVIVTDPAPSSGIAKVKATLSFTRTVKCRKTSSAGAAKTCKKTVRRTLQVTGGTGGKFTVVAKHLTPNTGYKIALVPFDNAGNRPQFSTITNVRTKPRHQRLL
jgi:secreted trypsin-like serine protease